MKEKNIRSVIFTLPQTTLGSDSHTQPHRTSVLQKKRKKKKSLKNIDFLKRRKVFCTIYYFMLSQFLNLLYTPGASRKVNKLEGPVIEVALNSGLELFGQQSIVCLCLFPHPPHLCQPGLKWWEAQVQSCCWGRRTANGCTQQECTSANWTPACWVGGC